MKNDFASIAEAPEVVESLSDIADQIELASGQALQLLRISLGSHCDRGVDVDTLIRAALRYVGDVQNSSKRLHRISSSKETA